MRVKAAYSPNNVYFIFEPYALELTFAFSIYLKCQGAQYTCKLEVSKLLDLEKIPSDVLEASRTWVGRKLPKKYYKLRNIELN